MGDHDRKVICLVNRSDSIPFTNQENQMTRSCIEDMPLPPPPEIIDFDESKARVDSFFQQFQDRTPPKLQPFLDGVPEWKRQIMATKKRNEARLGPVRLVETAQEELARKLRARKEKIDDN
ncbi:hypothetical protein Ciccas_014038 [Cichlidogyrus casuarinus]|uniref:Uncharacterized protein n=1 Tax=Cichlidogyrus casuarinus TaxID=1844966 RepID=A0ABD2PNX9_9PLAT